MSPVGMQEKSFLQGDFHSALVGKSGMLAFWLSYEADPGGGETEPVHSVYEPESCLHWALAQAPRSQQCGCCVLSPSMVYPWAQHLLRKTLTVSD